VDLFDEPKALGFELRDGNVSHMTIILTIVNIRVNRKDFLFLPVALCVFQRSGSGTPSCVQMRIAVGFLTSRCRGTVLVR
jgi:hypothetical protein